MQTLSVLALTAALAMPVGFVAMPVDAVAVARADDKQETARGAIKSIDQDKKSFVLATVGEGSKDVTVTVNEQTVYMKDGKVSTMAEVVKIGGTVTVTHKAGTASKVETFTTP